MPLPTTLLIANRGEIACRIVRTCRRLGLRTVAVYSDADADALHVREADTAVHLGPAPAAESYLRVDAVLDAARRTGADMIHPGYGFLSESAAFARAVRDAGLVLVGPSPEAMERLGDKDSAKALAAGAGVPIIKGYHGSDQDPDRLAQEAARIGFPLLIKAVAGGGGRGMRRVDGADTFTEALAACRREALAAFGRDAVLLERLVDRPRHVEVQVFGDTHGRAVHLFERDCTLQRRHQKIVEEAPAAGLDAGLREALGGAAVALARAAGYAGAGTVEFLLAPDGSFHFIEMNTRLQVEHPVTEAVTGLDLVAWQIQIAAGEPLPLRQEDIRLEGHAIEARLYAEDPARAHLPSTGILQRFRLPAATPWLRLETGVAEGDRVTSFYDPMIAKVIAHGPDRPTALARLATALGEVEVEGVVTNRALLTAVLAAPAFRDLRIDTTWLDREGPVPDAAEPDTRDLALAALGALPHPADRPASPWDRRDGWRLNAPPSRMVRFARPQLVAEVVGADDAFALRLGELVVQGRQGRDGQGCWAELEGRRVRFRAYRHGREIVVVADGRQVGVLLDEGAGEAGAGPVAEGDVRASLPGRIAAVLVELGQSVTAGQKLLVLEAMKMEHALEAPFPGTVSELRAVAGEQVDEGALLVAIERAA